VGSKKSPQVDWVLFAVLAGKSESKKASNGTVFASWRLTDLKGCFVVLNLFGDAFQYHWKQETGTVLAILNPSVLANVGVLSFFPLLYY
jgi:hypothetical protein